MPETFATLPEEEKKLWMSHSYEVTAGLLIAPELREREEKELMKILITTYGKAIHTWHSHMLDLPLGIPHYVMAYTKDGQVDEDLLAERN